MSKKLAKAKPVAIAALCLAALAIVMLSSVASAYSVVRVNRIWRGSGLAYLYIYGQARNQADTQMRWMEVQADLYELKSGVVYHRADAVDGGDYIWDVQATARYTVGYADHGTFKNCTHHYWDYDGYSFDQDYKESAWTYL